MLSNKVITRYAKALFDLADELKQVDAIQADMLLISQVAKANSDFVLMLSSPIIKTDKKTAILQAIFKDNISKLSLAYLLLITKKRREVYIPSIAEQYTILFKEFKGIKRAYLQTSIGIDSKIRTSIIDQLKKYTQNEIELVEEINNELIGGFILSFDNKQYDSSISKQLQAVAKKFNIKE